MSINEDNLAKNQIKKLSPEDIVNYLNYFQSINEKQFLLNETGITPRVINSWKKEGLMPSQDSERKWNKFSFIEFLWIKIIQELREFGFPIEKIKNVKDVLFLNTTNELIDCFINDKEGLLEYTKKLGHFDEEAMAGLNTLFDMEPNEIKAAYINAGIDMSLLSIMIFNLIIKKANNGLVIYSSGKCIPWLEEFSTYNIESMKVFDKHHIYISLNSLMYDFLSDERKDRYISSIQILSKEEHEILSLLRNNELKEVKIIFYEKGSKPYKYRLDIVSGKQVSKEEAQQLMRNMVFKNYESISFKTNNNKTVYIEKALKKIL